MNPFLHMYTHQGDHMVPVFILRHDAKPICGSCDRIDVSAIDAPEAGNVRDARTVVCRVWNKHNWSQMMENKIGFEL